MSLDAEILPVSYVEELVRALTRAMRAFQMYLPNNPMYHRGEQTLRDAFPPIWAVLDEVTLGISETDLVWEDQTVYAQANRSESFAFGLYKDGMRLLTLRKGCEEEEIGRFLVTVSRARLLPADASDDLLTLLWEQDFQRVTFQFTEVIADPWVYDPQALQLLAEGSDPERVQQQVREEARAPRPEGVVDLEDFDATLYFLDEIEIAELTRQVEKEYVRDLRPPALGILFDLCELQADPAVHGEVVAVLDTLFPSLLSRGDFHTVALILREIRAVVQRARQLSPDVRQGLERFGTRLSEPAAIGQLLNLLDEAAVLPPEDELAEVLGELQGPALGAILTQLPRLASLRVKTIVGAAAERLAEANAGELQALLAVLERDALPGAIQMVGRLGLHPASPPLADLVRHVAPEVRLAAVEVLGLFGTPGAMAGLEPAIDDVERPVRVAAVAAVTRRGYAGALRRLEAIVLGRGGLNLERSERRAAFEAYSAVAGPAGLETLRGVVFPSGLFRRKASSEARTCAVYALGRLRTPEARVVLEQLTSDKELPVRHAATSLLREWPG
jgi:hypothetical protein